MAWKTMDVQEQRVQFVVAASRREQPLSRLCEEFGISRPTGLLWVKRYRESGLVGIAERSRRPRQSPGRTAAALEEQVVALRRRYPDWGARKLRVLLGRQGVDLPRNTIHRILMRHGLVGATERQATATQRFEHAEPNQMWQMDFKGPKRWHQPVGPLSVLDDHSRYLILLRDVGSTQTEMVREQLEDAFRRCGVPEAMLMDHGVPWWNTLAPLGISKLAMWLMKQGIGLHWSRIRHPQTQGKVERFHGSLERALQHRGDLGTDAQAWLDRFRWEHNFVRPHEALGMATPASRWKPSLRRYDSNPPRWEYPEGAWVRKVDSSGKLKLEGRNWNISQALVGDWVQLVQIERRVQIYYCRTPIRELDLEQHSSMIAQPWLDSGSKRNRGARLLSFLRHGEIYPPDVLSKTREQACHPPPALIGTDETPAGYSLASCSPAEPASASPANYHSQGATKT